jgi:hypothetical protein
MLALAVAKIRSGCSETIGSIGGCQYPPMLDRLPALIHSEKLWGIVAIVSDTHDFVACSDSKKNLSATRCKGDNSLRVSCQVKHIAILVNQS